MTSHVSDRGVAPRHAMPVGVDNDRTAHLLLPMARNIERFGVSVCGYPAEHLTVLADTDWPQVLPDHRCPHCDVHEPATSDVPRDNSTA